MKNITLIYKSKFDVADALASVLTAEDFLPDNNYRIAEMGSSNIGPVEAVYVFEFVSADFNFAKNLESFIDQEYPSISFYRVLELEKAK